MLVRFSQLSLQALRGVGLTLRTQNLLSLVVLVAIIGIIVGVVVNAPLAEWAA